jgi:hypothetical protein
MSLDKQKERLAQLRAKKAAVQDAVARGETTKSSAPTAPKRDINVEMERVHQTNGDADATDNDDDGGGGGHDNNKKKKRRIDEEEPNTEGGGGGDDDNNNNDDDESGPAKKKQKKNEDDGGGDDERDETNNEDDNNIEEEDDEEKKKKEKRKQQRKESAKRKKKEKEKEKEKEKDDKKKKAPKKKKEGENDSKQQQQQPPKKEKKKTPEEEFQQTTCDFMEYRKLKRQEQWTWLKAHIKTPTAHYAVHRMVFVAAMIRCPNPKNNEKELFLYLLQPDTLTADGGTSQCWVELQNFLLAIGHSSSEAMRAEKRLCELMNSVPRVDPVFKRVLCEDGKTVSEMRCIPLEVAAMWALQEICLPSVSKKDGVNKEKLRKQVSSLLATCSKLGMLLSKHRCSSALLFDEATSKYLKVNEPQITLMKSLFVDHSSEITRLYSKQPNEEEYQSIDDANNPLSVICPEMAHRADNSLQKQKQKVLPLWWASQQKAGDDAPTAASDTAEAAATTETPDAAVTTTTTAAAADGAQSESVPSTPSTTDTAPAMEEVIESTTTTDNTTASDHATATTDTTNVAENDFI